MNRDIVWTSKFKKDYKLAIKRRMDINLLDDIIRALADGDAFGSLSAVSGDPQATSPPMSNVAATITPAARPMICFFFLLRLLNFSFMVLPPSS